MSEPITAKQYHDQIRSICQSAYEEYKLYQVRKLAPQEPEEWFSTWLHQTIDGHEWVIYTWYNSQVLTHSDNRNACWDEGVGPPKTGGFGELMAVLAHYAMAADVRALIDMSAFGEVAQ